MRYAFQIQANAGFSRSRCNSHLSEAHLKFLALLSQVDRCEMPLEDWPQWAVLWRWAHEGEFASKKEAESVRAAVESCGRRLADRNVPFHRVHGDFSPWHTMLGFNGLKVIDWEESEPHGLPLFDAVHFILVQYAYGKNKELPIERIINDSDFVKKISMKFKPLGYSYSDPDADIGKLATIYACMLLTCPSLRYSLWNL
jgi:aminoglycoside phosphotransferase (APT) family kinase protein